MDQERVTETLKLAWQANKLPKSEVTLIINSPQLRANRVDAPLLAEKKTSEFIERETHDSEYGRFQNPATGWYTVSKDTKAKTQRVVHETAEIDFVNKYVEIFTKAGLKLNTIHNGVHIATEYFTKQAAGKTVLYMILDGKSLVTIFFAEENITTTQLHVFLHSQELLSLHVKSILLFLLSDSSFPHST